MKNKLNSVLFVLILLVLIPKIAFASWWNPFSWFTKQPQAEQITPPVTKPVVNTKTKTQTIIPVSSNTQTTNNTQKKSTPKAIIAPVVSPVVVPPTPPVWDVCKNIAGAQSIAPDGLYVDNNGNCVPVPVAPVKTGYQVCSEQFSNGTWDGTMVNGKYNCVCQTGYVSNSAGTACQIQPAQDQTKTLQIQALKDEYNSRVATINQQIIDIKNQYYIDLKNVDGSGTWASRADAEKQNLLTNANTKIDQLKLQIDQLTIDYNNKINQF